MKYKNYIIEKTHGLEIWKYMYYHEDDTDGNMSLAKTEDEAKEEIDEKINES